MRTAIAVLGLLIWASLAHAEIIYVDIDATGADTGLAWDDAHTDVQAALGRASDGDEIWIAEGTYYPTDGTDRTISFVLPNGVSLYGGFDGTEVSRAERDWGAHLTILSGDIGEREPAARRLVLDRPATTAPLHEHRAWFDSMRAAVEQQLSTLDNSHQLVVADGVDDVFLDGLILQDASGQIDGAGLVCNSSTVTARNLVIRNNYTQGYGGGLYGAGNSLIHVEDSDFLSNSTAYVGAGAALLDTASLIVTGTTFRDCFAGINGGGVWANVSGTSVDIRDSEFLDNFADDTTGALAAAGEATVIRTRFEGNGSFWGPGTVSAASALHVESCSFIGNTSIEMTAGISSWGELTVLNSVFSRNETIAPPPFDQNVAAAIQSSGTLEVINATFAGNKSPQVGAVTHSGATPAGITNTLIWGNASIAGSIPVWTDTEAVMSHSIREDLSNTLPDPARNFALDPLFVNAANDDLTLQPGSPAIDAGDTFALPEGFEFDIAGNPRYMRNALDIGAHEALGPLSLEDPTPRATKPERHLYAAPNPFNPSTTIYYGVSEPGRVELTIYDLAGRKVKTLVSEQVKAGEHDVNWDGRDETGKRVASGVYLYRLAADEFIETRRMVLLK